jgi:hypothetical protein
MKTVVCENGDRLYVVNLVITEKERQELAMSLFDIVFTRDSNYKNNPIFRKLYNEVTQIKSRINYESRKEKI